MFLRRRQRTIGGFNKRGKTYVEERLGRTWPNEMVLVKRLDECAEEKRVEGVGCGEGGGEIVENLVEDSEGGGEKVLPSRVDVF